ncbi:MAG: hypothetical protein J0I45_16390 [Bosea sp.]|nr:hypothetical protein [Bosea sp. (in: a-proteobacteria)]
MDIALPADPTTSKAISMARKGFSPRAIKDAMGRWMSEADIRALVERERSEATVMNRIGILRQEEKRAEEQLMFIRGRIKMAERRLSALQKKLIEAMEKGSKSGPDAALEDIILRVSVTSGIARKELVWGGRQAALSIARHEIMYLAAVETSLSLPEIAERLGGMDHTSIIHGIRRHSERTGLPLPRGMKPYQPKSKP